MKTKNDGPQSGFRAGKACQTRFFLIEKLLLPRRKGGLKKRPKLPTQTLGEGGGGPTTTNHRKICGEEVRKLTTELSGPKNREVEYPSRGEHSTAMRERQIRFWKLKLKTLE